MGELSDEAKAEIADAIRILREDGVHIHRTYPAFLKSQEQPPESKPGEGDPPPPKDPPPPEEKPRKRGIGVWGRTE